MMIPTKFNLLATLVALLLSSSASADQFVPVAATCASTFTIQNSVCTQDATCLGKIGVAMASNTITQAPISLDSSQIFGDNRLHLVVRHLSIGGRTLTNIDLSGKAACNYPGPNWVKSVDASGAQCYDVYTALIPWDVAYSESSMNGQNQDGCGLVRSASADNITFDGVGLVSYIEEQPDIDTVAVPDRQVAQAFRFELTMPKKIGNIQATVKSFDDPNLERAVTSQQFNPANGKLSFSLLVSTPAPLNTTSVQSRSGPANVVITDGSIDAAGCDESSVDTCRKIYSFEFEPSMPAKCDVNGTYTFVFNIACQVLVNAANCPLGADQTTLTIDVVLSSEDLCAEVAKAITVSTALTSHGTFDSSTFSFGAAKNTFFQAQTVFYKLAIVSNDEFPMASSKILSVGITNKANSATNIFTDSVTPATLWAFGTLAKSSNLNSVTHEHEFKYTPHPTLFGDVERLSPITSTVTVEIEIIFTNSLRKRAVLHMQPSQFGKTINAQSQVGIVATMEELPAEPSTNAPVVAHESVTIRVTLDGAQIKSRADVDAAIQKLQAAVNAELSGTGAVATVELDTATGQLHVVITNANGGALSVEIQQDIAKLLASFDVVKQVLLGDRVVMAGAANNFVPSIVTILIATFFAINV